MTYSIIDESYGATYTKYLGDIDGSWEVILGSTAISFLVSFLYIFLLRRFAKRLIISTFIFMLVGQIILGLWICYYGYITYPWGSSNFFAYEAFGILFIFTTLIYLAALLFCAKNIKRAVAIVSAVLQLTKDVPTVFMIPMFCFTMISVASLYYVVSSLYFFSICRFSRHMFLMPRQIRYKRAMMSRTGRKNKKER